MRELLISIDRVLRGGSDAGKAAPWRERLRLLAASGVLLGTVYGVFMGLYGALRPQAPSLAQLAVTTLKVPLLFLLTLLVTFPSLYVLAALADFPVRFRQLLGLLLAGTVVTLALLASLGPVTGFFTLSTESYPFMVVLNVVFFAASGLAGLIFLRRALDAAVDAALTQESGAGVEDQVREAAQQAPEEKPLPPVAGPEAEGPLGPASKPPAPAGGTHRFVADRDRFSARQRTSLLFTGWILIYGTVGAQMGWILRPFIGDPALPFTVFRARRSNFFEAFLDSISQLMR
ncbi:MAG TPA: hypothetical protein VMT52_03865 [Planctomycetota bacterium]|nr:hypothetical protein [Planctomycetota bacterium]